MFEFREIRRTLTIRHHIRVLQMSVGDYINFHFFALFYVVIVPISSFHCTISASTISLTSSLNLTFGSQPRILLALDAFPTSNSTSAGRYKLESTTTWSCQSRFK